MVGVFLRSFHFFRPDTASNNTNETRMWGEVFVTLLFVVLVSVVYRRLLRAASSAPPASGEAREAAQIKSEGGDENKDERDGNEEKDEKGRRIKEKEEKEDVEEDKGDFASVSAHTLPRLTILFGTQSGTAEMFAKELEADARRRVWPFVQVLDVENYELDNIFNEELVVIIAATYIDGR